eukprot:Skav202948  [mRNA]  locus=scaffold422:531150:535265:+ [translate_table: standard]
MSIFPGIWDGYNPPDETFRITNFNKVKQCRRLRSLVKSYEKSFRVDSSCHPFPAVQFRRQFFGEWTAIRSAKGYGRSWDRWLLAFEVVTFVSSDLPTYDDLKTFTDITVVDCDASCKQEALNRANVKKFLLEVDVKEDFLSSTYKMVRGKPTPRLDEVPMTFSANAKLCRMTHGQPIQLQLTQQCDFLVQQPAFFGDAKVYLISQVGLLLTIRLIDGILPSAGELRQDRVSTCAQEVFHEFSRFWSPFWNRDENEEQFEPERWTDLLEVIDNVPLPPMQVNVILNSPSIWKQTIHKLKPGKSEGICGWRYGELKLLPDAAVSHLCEIFCLLWKVGLSTFLMTGKTVLLAKNDQPRSINDARPITILSCLYRLASKVVFDQVVAQWSTVLPFTISGGIPKRGVKDLAFHQAFAVEQAVTAGQPLMGACLDLVKAFNLIPRLPIRFMLHRMGMSWEVLEFWKQCLSRLSRVPVMANGVGEHIDSSTGLPEGDAWSVLGMIGLSTLFYFRLYSPVLTPCCFADNWSWYTSDQRQNFMAWQMLLNLVELLRMKIDFKKCWIWGSTRETRRRLENVNSLFPDGLTYLEVKYGVRDLGEIIQYSLKKFSKPLIERVQDTTQRLTRLEWIAIPFAEKAKVVLGGIWAHGLYGAELHFLGAQHFKTLRRAVCRIFAGRPKHSSSFLACTLLSKKILDPLFFVLQAAIRFLIRLADLFPQVFQQFMHFANTTARSTPCGPVSSIMKYLSEAGWQFTLEGCIHEDGFEINFRNDSCKEAFHKLQCAWFSHVHAMVCHRKGIPESLPDFWTTRSKFVHLENSQKKLLALNVVGGWQSEVTKSKWSAICDATCPLCGEPDTQRHRFLECCKLHEVRSNHAKACEILDTLRPDWMYHPIARLPENHSVYLACLRALTCTPDVEYIDDLPDHPRFYTDGSCENPTLSQYRRASWSVVLDTSLNQQEREQALQSCDPRNTMPQQFRCVMVGLTEGKQCIARSELFAIVKACEIVVFHTHTVGATFFTDSQYVMNVVNFLRLPQRPQCFKLANRDLIDKLGQLLPQRNFCFQKVKSHREFSSATDSEDLWNILGNHLADQSASLALRHVPSDFLQLRDEVIRDWKWESDRLDLVIKFYLELNVLRSDLVNKQSSQVRQAQCGVVQYSDLKDQDFSNVEPSVIPMLSHEMALCSLQGANLALNIVQWAQTLQWPPEELATPQQKLGITWLELLFNFYVVTGWLPPVRVSGHAVQSQYFPYHSVQAKSLMPSRRTASAMCLVFQNAVQAVESLLQTKFWKKPSKQGAGVLRLAGFFGESAGIMLRPTMLCSDQTIDHVTSYLQAVGTGKYLNLPLPELHVSPSVAVEPIDEPCSADRYRAWNRRKKAGL